MLASYGLLELFVFDTRDELYKIVERMFEILFRSRTHWNVPARGKANDAVQLCIFSALHSRNNRW